MLTRGFTLKKTPFLFPPDSQIWQINRYATGLLFGPAAVLLQVAHPRVAQGVADHSNFRGDALGRLRGTLTTVNRIAFGTIDEADAMKRRMDEVHGRVKGTTSAGMPGPQHYSAFEPDLLLWVLATLIDASIKGYEFVWQPLPDERRESLHADFRKFGTFFGLKQDHGPQSYEEHQAYFDEQLADPLLGSHPLCAEIAAAVVRPPAPWRDRLLGHVVDFLPIETVPQHIRKKLGLESTAWTRQRLTLLRPLAKLGFRALPKRFTYYPESYRAERQLRDLEKIMS